MILKEICSLFIDICRHTRKLSDHTIRAYKKDLEIFCQQMGEEAELQNIDRKALKRYVEWLCHQPTSMSSNKRRIACVKAMFRWMELDDHILINPFHKIEIKLKIPRLLPRNIPNAELTVMIKKARTDMGLTARQQYDQAILAQFIQHKRDLNKLTTIVVLELLISTGIRVGELVAIKQSHVYWQEGRIRILGKGQRERYVFLPDPELINLLKSYLNLKTIVIDVQQRSQDSQDQFLLTNSRGHPASTQYIRKLIKNLTQKTDINRNITPHMYRHSAACQLLEADVDIRFVPIIGSSQYFNNRNLYPCK